MRVLLQRVQEAQVTINGKIVGAIQQGLLVFLGVEEADQTEDEEWLVRKIVNLRLFNDAQGVMNKSLLEIGGELLLISQFTLHANVKKGNRPSYNRAAKPEIALPKYEAFLRRLKFSLGADKVKTGEFGAEMKVHLINDGPVTIWADSKNKRAS
jgi:D-tyrosyl-tRNA(Tyr) deacylase